MPRPSKSWIAARRRAICFCKRGIKGDVRQEILYALSDQADSLPRQGAHDDFAKTIDFGGCLKLINRRWDDVFGTAFSLKKAPLKEGGIKRYSLP